MTGRRNSHRIYKTEMMAPRQMRVIYYDREKPYYRIYKCVKGLIYDFTEGTSKELADSPLGGKFPACDEADFALVIKRTLAKWRLLRGQQGWIK
jgi:hypothetical protein